MKLVREHEGARVTNGNPFREVPFIWPGVPEAGDREPVDLGPWLGRMAASADRIFGIVSGASGEGVELIAETAGREGCYLRLLIVLQPACATRSEDLRALLEVQAASSSRAEFRLLTSDTLLCPVGTVVAFLEPNGTRGCLLTGPTPVFGSLRPETGHANFGLEVDAIVFDAWRKWFDWTWATAAPLNSATVEIPRLVPATGTPEGAALWAAYAARCRDAAAGRTESDEASVDPKTGEVTVVGADGQRKPTVSETLGLPKLDPLGQEMGRLFQRGQMATIDKGSRMRPLDVPIPTEWFGIERSRQVGSMHQETSFRISAFDERTRKLVDQRRSMTRTLLDKLSFPLGEGVRWMPASATALFAKEMARADTQGREFFKSAVKGSAKAFVEVHRARVEADAQAMYETVSPGGRLPPHVLERILGAMKERLDQAEGATMLAQVIFRSVQFTTQSASQWHSQWGDALTLLRGIAELPRKALSDTSYWKDLDVDWDEWREALDVCKDPFFDLSPGGRNVARARAELELIGRIGKSEAADRDRCDLLYSFIRGQVSAEAAARMLAALEKVTASAAGAAAHS